MALQTSGQIAMFDINDELGFATTRASNIEEANFRNLAGVLSGPIDLFDFYGKSVLSWTTPFTLDKTFTSGTVKVELTLASDGSATGLFTTVTPTLVGWRSLLGAGFTAGFGAAYETRLVNKVGAAVTGPTLFTSLASGVSYSVSRTTVGVNTATFDVEIRLIGNAGSMQSASITLVAERATLD